MSTNDQTETVNPEVAALSYEEAKEELKRIVVALETGSAPLEETLKLWGRGEDLAKHCRSILTAAQVRVDSMTQGESEQAQ